MARSFSLPSYTGNAGKVLTVNAGANGVEWAAGGGGATGYTGYTGYTGPAGPTGATGYTGYTGYTGPGNFTGYTGYTGYTGPAGSPGGSDTQVQFNDGGSFGGDAGLTYNKTTDTLSVLGMVSVGGNSTQSGELRIYEDTDAGTNYTAFKVGTQAADLTLTLPTAYAAVTGYVLSSTDAGVLSWIAAAGLSWGSSITGSSGVGLTLEATSTGTALVTSGATGAIEALTVNNSSAASTIGKTITIGNTQTQAITGLKIDVGTSSSLGHIALDVVLPAGNAFTYGIRTASSEAYATFSGDIAAKNDANNRYFALWTINANSGAGTHSGLQITNNETTGITIGSNTYSSGIGVTQSGAGGVAISVLGGNNVNSSTNGLVNYALTSTQSGATVMQKIDLGTSAQGHTGLLVNGYNASSSISGFKFDGSSSGTGIGYYATGSNASLRSARFENTGAASAYQIDVGGSASNGLLYFNTNGGGAWGTSIATFMNFANNGLGDVNFKFIGSLQDRSGLISTAQTNNIVDIRHTRSRSNTSGTVADNFSMMYLKRDSATTGAGGTLTAAGSVMKLENAATQTAGTLTDTVDILQITQDADSTGNPISITQNAVTSTNFRRLIKETATGITIWMGNGTTANGALSGTAGDILINGGTNKPEYCTGTTNWTALV